MNKSIKTRFAEEVQCLQNEIELSDESIRNDEKSNQQKLCNLEKEE